MKDNNLEDFLRSNKPQVKDDSSFLVGLNSKLEAVEGIKKEVETQNRLGRKLLVGSLFAGFVLGAVAAAFILLHPVDINAVNSGWIDKIAAALENYKTPVFLGVGICATALGLLAGRQKSILWK